MSKKPKVYSAEFKNKAIGMVKSGKSALSVSKQLKIGYPTLQRWLKAKGSVTATTVVTVTPNDEILLKFKNRLKDLEERCEVLRIVIKELSME